MKKINIIFMAIVFVAISCKDEVIQKPNNLIPKDKMENIIYDLAILEATRTHNYTVKDYPSPTDFIKRKYKIDSLSFAKSTQYYASDINEYKKMYDNVKDRLTKENAKLTKSQVQITTEKIPENGIVK
jgi:hypothetical protein